MPGNHGPSGRAEIFVEHSGGCVRCANLPTGYLHPCLRHGGLAVATAFAWKRAMANAQLG